MGKETFNKQFFDNYDKIREFLRIVSYGCFSAKDIRQILQKKDRSYNDYLQRFGELLPQDTLAYVDYSRHKRPAIRMNAHDGSDNALAETYYLKTLKQTDVFLNLYLMIFLHEKTKGKKSLKLGEILSGLEIQYIPYSITRRLLEKKCLIEMRTLKKHLQSLSHMGLVVPEKEGRYFRIAKNPLESLNELEVQQLIFAIDFYKNIAIMSVPGYFLIRTLQHLHKLPPHKNNCFRIRNADNRRILDDGVVYSLLMAMEQGRNVSFEYRQNLRGKEQKKKCYKVFPKRIVTDCMGNGRQRLISFEKAKNPEAQFRIEDIYGLKKGDKAENIRTPRVKSSQKHEIDLRFIYNTEEEKISIRQRIEEWFPEVIYEEEQNNSIKVKFYCDDPVKYLPIIRSFLPYVEILGEPKQFLRNKMKKHIEEVMKNYGEA